MVGNRFDTSTEHMKRKLAKSQKKHPWQPVHYLATSTTKERSKQCNRDIFEYTYYIT